MKSWMTQMRMKCHISNFPFQFLIFPDIPSHPSTIPGPFKPIPASSLQMQICLGTHRSGYDTDRPHSVCASVHYVWTRARLHAYTPVRLHACTPARLHTFGCTPARLHANDEAVFRDDDMIELTVVSSVQKRLFGLFYHQTFKFNKRFRLTVCEFDVM